MRKTDAVAVRLREGLSSILVRYETAVEDRGGLVTGSLDAMTANALLRAMVRDALEARAEAYPDDTLYAAQLKDWETRHAAR